LLTSQLTVPKLLTQDHPRPTNSQKQSSPFS
jgi:hypothetical protein